MREPAVTANIVKAFNTVPECRAKKKHSGKFGGGDPDLSGVYRGRAFFVEVKKLDGLLTELQAAELEKWREVGAAVFVGIYDPVTKKLAFVQLDASENWPQFARKGALHELWETSVTQHAPLREFDLLAWLESTVASDLYDAEGK